MKKIIGITGVKGSGKTTCFEFIKEIVPSAKELALAKKLKDVSASVFELERSHFDDQKFKEKRLEIPVMLDEQNVRDIVSGFGFDPDGLTCLDDVEAEAKTLFDIILRKHIGKILHTPREVAQYVGTEILREVDTDIHCKATFQDLPDYGVFVITDIRFWNEYNFFGAREDCNFYPVYVANYGAEAKASSDKHASEKYVLEIAKKCEKLDNNGTLKEFKTKVRAFIVDKKYIPTIFTML